MSKEKSLADGVSKKDKSLEVGWVKKITAWYAENQLKWVKGRSKEASYEATTIIQMREMVAQTRVVAVEVIWGGWVLDTFWRNCRNYFLTNWMWMWERGVKDGSKVIILSIWKDGVTINWGEKYFKQKKFRGKDQEFVFRQVSFVIPIRYPNKNDE